MTGRDLLDLQREAIKSGELENTDAYRNVMSRLHVLHFHLDRKYGTNIVSELKGTIVFIDNKYYGESIRPDEVWLCSVEFSLNNVFYAMPLKKITSSVLMGLGEGVRKEIVDGLWNSNRMLFEEEFRERYFEEAYQRGSKDATERAEDRIAGLVSRIEELEEELAGTRMMLQGAPGPTDVWIELSSDDSPATVETPRVTAEEVPRPSPPTPLFRSSLRTPGMPEIHRPESENERERRVVRVERFSHTEIRCEELADGRYFVHITPSCGYLVIRPNPHGSAYCKDHVIRLDHLERLAPFDGRRELVGEYPVYGGLMIPLNPLGAGEHRPNDGPRSPGIGSSGIPGG